MGKPIRKGDFRRLRAKYPEAEYLKDKGRISSGRMGYLGQSAMKQCVGKIYVPFSVL